MQIESFQNRLSEYPVSSLFAVLTQEHIVFYMRAHMRYNRCVHVVFT